MRQSPRSSRGRWLVLTMACSLTFVGACTDKEVDPAATPSRSSVPSTEAVDPERARLESVIRETEPALAELHAALSPLAGGEGSPSPPRESLQRIAFRLEQAIEALDHIGAEPAAVAPLVGALAQYRSLLDAALNGAALSPTEIARTRATVEGLDTQWRAAVGTIVTNQTQSDDG